MFSSSVLHLAEHWGRRDKSSRDKRDLDFSSASQAARNGVWRLQRLQWMFSISHSQLQIKVKQFGCAIAANILSNSLHKYNSFLKYFETFDQNKEQVKLQIFQQKTPLLNFIQLVTIEYWTFYWILRSLLWKHLKHRDQTTNCSWLSVKINIHILQVVQTDFSFH